MKRFYCLPLVLLSIAASAHADCETYRAEVALGVVVDLSSGLTWTRCLLGQTGVDCASAAANLSWVDALNRARASEQGGISRWRLPKIDELRSAADCLSGLLPGVGASTVWSASANIDYATDAWTYDFTQADAIVRARDREAQVLLVSGP